MERDCPFCKGTGRVKAEGGLSEVYPEGLTCDSCRATGSYEIVKLQRAFHLGQRFPEASATLEQLKAMVIDDLRQQRVGEMLNPESVEIRELRRRLEVCAREREPLLRAYETLATEIRERLYMEIPA